MDDAPNHPAGPAPSPRPTAILETVLYVDDLDETAAFYRHLFGLTEVFADSRMRALGVPDGTVLLLFPRGGATEPVDLPGGRIPPHDGHGPMHVAFAFAPGSLAAWRARLDALGVPVESAVRWAEGMESLYFRDPSGNVVELAPERLWAR